MGMTGERIAEKFGITREEADAFSVESNRQGRTRYPRGKIQGRDQSLSIPRDKPSTPTNASGRTPHWKGSLRSLRRSSKDGILTAGNSSKLSDGAAALVVTSARAARASGIEPLARIIGYATGGAKPEDVMEAPIPTVKKLLAKTGFTMDDMDLVEHNEAYATASIAVSRALDIDPQKLNVHGGAVALGHPIGCSGARVLVTLIHALKDRGLKRGLATLCLGGGNAVAMIVER